MPKKIPLNVEQKNELRYFFKKKTGSAAELARAQAIYMLEQKNDFAFIEEMTGLKKSTIYDWRA